MERKTTRMHLIIGSAITDGVCDSMNTDEERFVDVVHGRTIYRIEKTTTIRGELFNDETHEKEPFEVVVDHETVFKDPEKDGGR